MSIATSALPQIASELRTYMEKRLYSKKTVHEYQRIYHCLFLHLSENSVDQFDKSVAFSFVGDYCARGEEPLSRNYSVYLIRHINVLFEFYTEGFVYTKKYDKKARQLRELGDVYDKYVSYQMGRGLAAGTIKLKSLDTMHFFLHLEDHKVKSLWDVRVDDVYNYLQTMNGYTVSTREGILYRLRDALRFFSSSGLCKKELGELFPQISTHPESPVPSCFSADEIKIILSAIDRKTSIGKRDYAVILLAALMGVRAGDINHLKLSSIKWASESIEFIQRKTGRFLQLPLLPEIKFAVLDYLKWGRPATASDNIFVKHRAPYTSFHESNCFHNALNKYLDGINLKHRKHGLHSLRFSAAGNLLSIGTPITTICNVLGHSYSDTTKRYLKIDINNLRKAALEVGV